MNIIKLLVCIVLVTGIGIVFHMSKTIQKTNSENQKYFGYIAKIESQMRLPYDAGPLGSYKRLYATEVRYDRPVILGIYNSLGAFPSHDEDSIHPVPDLPNAYFVSKELLPYINDGGCGVVTIIFDLTTENLISFDKDENGNPIFGFCNGHA